MQEISERKQTMKNNSCTAWRLYTKIFILNIFTF
ncbi:hypothetical protein TcasGA2_TC033084 [Tribolium castaneum]|uniref:Uncharacterized protein n=1 Tax=Tribolium castaneum TaxID=7070 RepID=A0A139WID6_TRICA|nr:hypothetical protein TcasGA2_TC033084 [Tribolium castaneum]